MRINLWRLLVIGTFGPAKHNKAIKHHAFYALDSQKVARLYGGDTRPRSLRDLGHVSGWAV